jgi:hypothetical protein
MKSKYSIITASLALALAGPASQAHAAVVNVITPTGVTLEDSSPYNQVGSLTNLINNSGLSTPFGTTVDTASLPTVTESNPDVSGYRMQMNSPLKADFVFALTGSNSFSGILIGNYWENNDPGLSNRGISTFGLQISTDSGATWSANLQTVTPAQSTGNIEYIDLGTTYTNVTNVKFNDATYFSNDGADLMGLNEVRFTVVPEPSTALLGGLGVLALLRRRRA